MIFTIKKCQKMARKVKKEAEKQDKKQPKIEAKKERKQADEETQYADSDGGSDFYSSFQDVLSQMQAMQEDNFCSPKIKKKAEIKEKAEYLDNVNFKIVQKKANIKIVMKNKVENIAEVQQVRQKCTLFDLVEKKKDKEATGDEEEERENGKVNFRIV